MKPNMHGLFLLNFDLKFERNVLLAVVFYGLTGCHVFKKTKLLLYIFYLSDIFFEKIMLIIHDHRYFDHLIYDLASCLFEISTCYSVFCFFFNFLLLLYVVTKQFASNAFMKDFSAVWTVFLCQIIWKLTDTE